MAIQSFNAVVNLEFLLVLSKVFTSALATDESDSTSLLASQHVSQEVAVTHPSVSVATTDHEPPQIDVKIAVKDPEIILLADGRDKNTNALFLKVSTYPAVHSWKKLVHIQQCIVGKIEMEVQIHLTLYIISVNISMNFLHTVLYTFP